MVGYFGLLGWAPMTKPFVMGDVVAYVNLRVQTPTAYEGTRVRIHWQCDRTNLR